MSDKKLIEFEQRLAFAEREVELARAQFRALQAQHPPRSRLRRDGVVGLVALVLVLGTTHVLNTQAQGAPPQVLTVSAPFRVIDAAGKVLFEVEAGSGRPSLTIGNPATGSASMGVGTSGAGYLLVRNPAGKAGIALGEYHGTSMGVSLIASDGATVVGSLGLAGVGASLDVGEAKSGGVRVGVGKSGAGFVVVRRVDGQTGIDMGQLEGRPMAVGVFGDNKKELVSLRTDQKGGTVRVATSSGAAVAGLLAGESGGGVELTGPAGGKSAVSLSVQPSGGKVRVFPQAGGPANAELAAGTAGGAVTVYSTSGTPIASVNSKDGKGYLELNDATGTKMVEAGSLDSHKGYVLVTPWRPSPESRGDPSVLRGGGK